MRALAGGFGIFLLRQYFLTIPRDLYEAAVLDGCGYGRYLWSILLPLSRPALATLNRGWSIIGANPVYPRRCSRSSIA